MSTASQRAAGPAAGQASGGGGFRQVAASDGALVLLSPVLSQAGIQHGFATRLGGVSEGSFAELNFGLKGGDRPENVRANLRRLGLTVGFDPDRCYRLQQVHGREVVLVGREESPPAVAGRRGDALVTDRPGVTLGVVTADCVPVLLADPAGTVVAAVHAGWRGLAARVLEAAVTKLCGHPGVRAGALLAAVGPCIGPCCYEVGEEVAVSFQDYAGAVDRGRGTRPFLDLAAIARRQLLDLGLAPDRMDGAGLCTRCRSELFFSFRRDGAASGHHLSVISVAGD